MEEKEGKEKTKDANRKGYNSAGENVVGFSI